MIDYTIFERNMLALASGRTPQSAERIRKAEPDRNLVFERARSGSEVPVMLHQGYRRYLHSRFDPEQEGSRLADESGHRGFIVFLGLGAGYSILPFLKADRLSRGIIIEYNAPALRTILETIDLTPILADRRLDLLVDPDRAELHDFFVASYVPSLFGNLAVVPLNSRVQADSQNFQQASSQIRHLMESVSDDYSVQAFFGKRWFSNIVRNLRQAAGATVPVGPVQTAAVSAAGPSLEDFLPELRERSGEHFLIATDTSLSVLMAERIIPQAVISIDCQHISYYHFMRGLPEAVPVFLDLASPPTVARLCGGSYFFCSGHPLARYVAARFRAFPILDTSGGNVTHAAVSLADYLGAKHIDLYGADFSYPAGKAYARGSYIYTYFDVRQQRLRPQEALFSQFLFRNQSMDHETDKKGHIRYITKPLVAYRSRLESLAAGTRAKLRPHIGSGMPIKGSPGGDTRNDFGHMFAAGRQFRKAEEFLEEYRDEIAGLTPPAAPAGSYLSGLRHREQDIWMTLLPAAAAIRREPGRTDTEPEEILELTRRWCLSKVDQSLDDFSRWSD